MNGMMAILLSLFVMTNTVHAQLYINEFMASNDAALPGPDGQFPDWIEIYNAGPDAVMLGGYYMYDTLDVTVAFQIPDTYPDSVTVDAGGFILFYANKKDDESVLNLNFKLSGSGEQVGLWGPDQTEIDGITYGNQSGDISFGRFPDGGAKWGFMSDYSPGTANAMIDPPSVQLFINEFMASNDAALAGPMGDYPDWIEIYNAGAEAVNLGGYYMYDTLDASVAYQIPDTYPDSVTVQPGEYILFYANKKTDWSVLNLGFKLSGDGEQVGLWSPEQEMLDGITYNEQFPDTSYGRYTDGTDDWYLMSDFTPGASNTNPNPGPGDVTLYINEFMASNDFAYPGPQGDNPDWIEIYNAGEEAVMLGGYYMADGLSDPADMFQISDAYPDSVTVEAGGFIVLYANKDPEWSVLNLDFSLSKGGEEIGLWDPNQNILDSIIYDEQITDTSYGRYTDGTDDWYFMPDFTPGASNMYVDAVIENESNVVSSINYPNPFSNETTIEFTLNETDNVQVIVYNINGAVLATIADGQFASGKHSIKWSTNGLPAGYYFYSIKTSSSTVMYKMSKIR